MNTNYYFRRCTITTFKSLITQFSQVLLAHDLQFIKKIKRKASCLIQQSHSPKLHCWQSHERISQGFNFTIKCI